MNEIGSDGVQYGEKMIQDGEKMTKDGEKMTQDLSLDGKKYTDLTNLFILTYADNSAIGFFF